VSVEVAREEGEATRTEYARLIECVAEQEVGQGTQKKKILCHHKNKKKIALLAIKVQMFFRDARRTVYARLIECVAYQHAFLGTTQYTSFTSTKVQILAD
jgi:hypothetical protein